MTLQNEESHLCNINNFVRYMDGLKDTLIRLYPLHQQDNTINANSVDVDPFDSSLHIYYPGEFDYREFVPLSGTYILLFIYIYFSVRKIELVRSKVSKFVCNFSFCYLYKHMNL